MIQSTSRSTALSVSHFALSNPLQSCPLSLLFYRHLFPTTHKFVVLNVLQTFHTSQHTNTEFIICYCKLFLSGVTDLVTDVALHPVPAQEYPLFPPAFNSIVKGC